VSVIDFFTTKPDVVFAPDRIWLTPEAKFNGLVAQVQDRLDENQFVFVLAHFPATLARVEQGLSAAGVPNGFVDGRLTRNNLMSLIDQANGQRVLLVLADSLAFDEMPLEINDSVEEVTFVVAERHFLRQKDEAISCFARTLGRPCEVVFYLSLHDPMMKPFSGDWLDNVLHRLGMGKSKAIEGKMVARQIKSAQANLSSGLLSDRRANSAKEWLQLNVPDMAV
jgi:preprotein translocase subunit SecA